MPALTSDYQGNYHFTLYLPFHWEIITSDCTVGLLKKMSNEIAEYSITEFYIFQ